MDSTPARAATSTSAYAPYGDPDNGMSDLGFTGKGMNIVNGTTPGLYDFPFREYQPTAGRWLSPDPAGLAAVNPADPQTWNKYAYVGNQPLSAVDPLGLLCIPGHCPGSGGFWHWFTSFFGGNHTAGATNPYPEVNDITSSVPITPQLTPQRRGSGSKSSTDTPHGGSPGRRVDRGADLLAQCLSNASEKLDASLTQANVEIAFGIVAIDTGVAIGGLYLASAPAVGSLGDLFEFGHLSTAVRAAVAPLPFLYFRGLIDKINALDSYNETEAECRAAYE